MADPARQDAAGTIPTFNLARWTGATSADRRQLAATLFTDGERYGCFRLCGHGVAPRLIGDVRDAYRRFFDLPTAEKLRCRRSNAPVNRGYYGLDEATISGQGRQPELRELFAVGPVTPPANGERDSDETRMHFAPNIWPVGVRGFRAATQRYLHAMETMCGKLLDAVAAALGEPEGSFADKVDRHTSLLRVADYPAQPVAPTDGRQRCSEHTDLSIFTVIHFDDAPGGLQYKTRDGAWHDPGPLGEDLFVLFGDLMKIWTNERWHVPPHRVSNPTVGAAADSRRQSVQFFYQPNYDALLACVESCRVPGQQPAIPPVTLSQLVAIYMLQTLNPI